MRRRSASWLLGSVLMGLALSCYPLLATFGGVAYEGAAVAFFWFSVVVSAFLSPVVLSLDWWIVVAVVGLALLSRREPPIESAA